MQVNTPQMPIGTIAAGFGIPYRTTARLDTDGVLTTLSLTLIYAMRSFTHTGTDEVNVEMAQVFAML
jgi:hypothetical protein